MNDDLRDIRVVGKPVGVRTALRTPYQTNVGTLFVVKCSIQLS